MSQIYKDRSTGPVPPVVATTYTTDSGNAVPAANILNVLGDPTGITTTSGSGNTILIYTPAGGIIWNQITSATNPNPLVNGNGYVTTDNGSLVTTTLPITAAVGDTIRILGQGSAGWNILQNAGQSIHLQSDTTTIGVGGSITFDNRYDSVELICIVANLEFVCATVTGNLNFL